MKTVSLRRIITILLGILVIYSILLAIFYSVEKGHPESSIHNFSDVIWWFVVTVTTVGYGDIVPASESGRIIGYVFILTSLGTYAVLIGQISSIMNTLKENKKLGQFGTKFQHHVVIIGWTDFGKAVTDQLVGAGRDVAIVTKVRNNVDLIRDFYKTKKIFVLFTDYNNFEQLDKLNIQDSSIVFVNLLDDTEKLVYILNLKKTFPELKFVVTLENANLKNTFISAGVTYAISKNELASKLLASYIFEPDVAGFNEEIIAYADTEEKYDMKEYLVSESNPYVQQKYGKIFHDLKTECNVILVGIAKIQDGKRVLLKNADDDVLVETGDYLLMIMNRQAMEKLTDLFQTEEGLGF